MIHIYMFVSNVPGPASTMVSLGNDRCACITALIEQGSHKLYNLHTANSTSLNYPHAVQRDDVNPPPRGVPWKPGQWCMVASWSDQG